MSSVQLGLRGNGVQVSNLLLIVVFIGAIVGVERSVLPLLAESEFGLVSATATVSFLVTFGIAKALANFLAGDLASRVGRRRILLIAWGFGIPVPLLLMWAPSWSWIVFANFLLGINQGLAWSTTQIMKLDLGGPRRRGLLMGLNEAAGYLSVALAALGAGYLAAIYGPRPAPYLIALVSVFLGLAVTLLAVRDTDAHVEFEQESVPEGRRGGMPLWAVNQAGLVNNLKEGVAWGLLPIYFAAEGLDLKQVGWLSALYPAVWAVVQLATGPLSDQLGRRMLIVGGLLLQALALVGFATFTGYVPWVAAAVVLGFGTGAIYPTLIAQVGDLVRPGARASAVGRYRLWRDLGYVIGALMAGLLTDWLGIQSTLVIIALLLVGSAALAREYLPAPASAVLLGVPLAKVQR